ncbi:glutamate racemase [Deinococcus sp. Marseille-Q6407]|uniref:glutamate racemase n=1 Tax=Deinococcus sp. Marseille-Q6407 TaxID=2969223 RepID=UPI0021C185BF|nr:glutamate racemase [Deinococcus sp. Marseille-Q6407]
MTAQTQLTQEQAGAGRYDGAVNEAAPIGVFDSGVGGLSVLAELRRALPHERFCYLADTAHMPYGTRSDDDIRILTEAAARWLHGQGCKALVVACNTASAYGLQHLRHVFPDWPIVGLVPAVKPAALNTQSGVIGVMATPATLRGSKLQQSVAEWAAPRGVQVMLTTSPELVPLVERGEADSPDARALLRLLLRPLAEAGADQLVLGCTHYPFLAGSIRREFKEQFTLIDSGEAVARQTARVLRERGLLAPAEAGGCAPQVTYFVTGDPLVEQPIMARLAGEAVQVGWADAEHTAATAAATAISAQH